MKTLTKEEFREIREKLELSQTSLGKKIDRSLRTVRNYETGVTNIDLCVSLAMRFLYHSTYSTRHTRKLLHSPLFACKRFVFDVKSD